MVILEEDVKAMTHFIARNISKNLKVEEYDFKSTPELIEDIKRLDPETFKTLEAFLTAYREWFNFHKKIDQEGKSGNLSITVQQELIRLIQDRDKSRAELFKRVNDLR